MKLSGTAALYEQRKQLQAALAVTDKQIAMAEEFGGETAPAKKTRRKRMPKTEQQVFAPRHGDTITLHRPNGAEDHAE